MCIKYNITTRSNVNEDQEYKEMVSNVLKEFDEHMNKLQFHKALEAVMNLVDYLNKYVDKKAPWTLAKNNDSSLKDVLLTLVDGILISCFMLNPFMPHKMKEVFESIGVNFEKRLPGAYETTFESIKQKLTIFAKID